MDEPRLDGSQTLMILSWPAETMRVLSEAAVEGARVLINPAVGAGHPVADICHRCSSEEGCGCEGSNDELRMSCLIGLGRCNQGLMLDQEQSFIAISSRTQAATGSRRWHRRWRERAADLLRVGAGHGRDGIGTDRTGWPRNPRAFADRLRRVQTSCGCLASRSPFAVKAASAAGSSESMRTRDIPSAPSASETGLRHNFLRAITVKGG
jgi:hypothetical protein